MFIYSAINIVSRQSERALYVGYFIKVVRSGDIKLESIYYFLYKIVGQLSTRKKNRRCLFNTGLHFLETISDGFIVHVWTNVIISGLNKLLLNLTAFSQMTELLGHRVVTEMMECYLSLIGTQPSARSYLHELSQAVGGERINESLNDKGFFPHVPAFTSISTGNGHYNNQQLWYNYEKHKTRMFKVFADLRILATFWQIFRP